MRGLAKFLGFILFLLALWYGRDALIRRDVEKQSREFVESAVGAMTRPWNRAALDTHADPSLVTETNAVGNPHALDFAYYATLGVRISEVKCTLGDYTTFRDETKNYIAANYLCAVAFERGPATIVLSVLRDKETQPWRIVYFDVTSPSFPSPAR